MANLTSGAAKAVTPTITADRRGRNIKNAFWQLHDGIAGKVEGMSTNARNIAVNDGAAALLGWNFQAGAPSVLRENALFVGLAGIYLVVGIFVLTKYGRD